MGDSITVGYADNPTWSVPFEFGFRGGLYAALINAGHGVQFVGQSPEPWDALFGLPVNAPTLDLRQSGQDKHRGYGGITIEELSRNVAGYIESDKPDVILLLIGINGINRRSPRKLNTLVENIRTALPDGHLVVAQIPPFTSFNQDLWDYNVYIRDELVPTYAAEGYSVTTVDLYSLFLKDTDDPTSILPALHSNKINHPSNVLYNQIAHAWFAGLERIL
ncbi:MAG: hypothetical protein HQ492_01550 [Woeseiaceae bacterium]|nr:hypothetical protein [Woeseiaceae bacterium]